MQQILEYSFARIIVRLIGVVMVLWGSTTFAGVVFYGVSTFVADTGSWKYSLPYVAGSGMTGLIVALVGFGFARNGHALARLVTRGIHGRCRVCGYDIRATPGPKCPECDAAIPGRPDKPGE